MVKAAVLAAEEDGEEVAQGLLDMHVAFLLEPALPHVTAERLGLRPSWCYKTFAYSSAHAAPSAQHGTEPSAEPLGSSSRSGGSRSDPAPGGGECAHAAAGGGGGGAGASRPCPGPSAAAVRRSNGDSSGAAGGGGSALAREGRCAPSAVGGAAEGRGSDSGCPLADAVASTPGPSHCAAAAHGAAVAVAATVDIAPEGRGSDSEGVVPSEDGVAGRGKVGHEVGGDGEGPSGNVGGAEQRPVPGVLSRGPAEGDLEGGLELLSLHVSRNLLEGGTGCHDWEAGFLMAEFVLSNPHLFSGAA